LLSRAGDVLGFAVEEELVRAEGSRAGGSGVCAQVGLREGYGEGGVGREVELGVALAPVSEAISQKKGIMGAAGSLDDGNVHRGGGRGGVDLVVGHCRDG
jgi:hypothetical protein